MELTKISAAGVNPAAPAPAPGLQARIQQLVDWFQREERALPGVCRELCQLADRHQLDPEDFRRRLVQAGLAGSRASELKLVCQTPEALQKFLAEKDPRSWRRTLADARTRAKLAALAGERRSRVDLRLAQLAGLLHRHRVGAVQVENFVLQLSPSAAAPFALLEAVDE